MPTGHSAAVHSRRSSERRLDMALALPASPVHEHAPSGKGAFMLTTTLHRSGLRGPHLEALSIGSVGLCIGLWIRAKTVDQDERGNAERRALFVGLWAPMLWQIGDSLRAHAPPPRRS